MDLSVVIPCYNEEESLRETYSRVKAACGKADVRSYEIILVNDGSRDGTLGIMRELSAADPMLVAVDLSRNHGQQLALTAGLAQAKGDYIFIIDADLQDPPELLAPMLERARAGIDVVYGKRERRQGETFFKLLCASMFYRILSWLSDVSIPRDTGDFRLISRRVLEQFLAMPEHYRFIRGMISWIGFKQEAFLYVRDQRFAGVTKYTFFKLVHYAFDAISSFSIRPLRISLLFALIGVCIAAIMAMVAVIFAFQHRTVAGWASIVSMIAFFGSLQLISIGVIGEYIGRTYIEVKKRPLFIIRKIYASDPSD